MSQLNIGVLGLQGDVAEHLASLSRCGVAGCRVRRAGELAEVDGLIIPGGESSTIGMLLDRFGLMEPLRERIRGGMPVYGTCAGLILLATEIEGSRQTRIGCMDVAVLRNAYGRQVDSFEAPLQFRDEDQPPMRGIFIRAPRITRLLDPEVQVLMEAHGDPVLVRQGTMLAGSFHPELTDDARVHRYFVEMVRHG